jgi:hypothetical protein
MLQNSNFKGNDVTQFAQKYYFNFNRDNYNFISRLKILKYRITKSGCGYE